MATSSISNLLQSLLLDAGEDDRVVVGGVFRGDDGLLYIYPTEDMRPEDEDELERVFAAHPTRFHYVRRAPRPRGRTRISALGFLRAAGWVAVVAVGIALATRHTRA